MKYVEVTTKEAVKELFKTYPTVIIDTQIDMLSQDKRPGETLWHQGVVLVPDARGSYTSNSRVHVEITADMVKYISTMDEVVMRHAQPGPSFALHTFYCAYTLFMSNPLNINKGFPENMDYKSLVPGAVVSVCWLDSEPTVCMVIDVDHHAHNYKGERSFKALDSQGHIQRCVQTQIVSFIDGNGLQTMMKQHKYLDALLAIEQIAQGQTNKQLRRVCDIASGALADE